MKRYLADRAWALPTSCLVLTGFALACGSRASSDSARSADRAGSHSCRPVAHTERPSLPPPHPAPPARVGELWMSIDLPLSALEREFEQRVPKTLAREERRPIGGPGDVTYRVTRGKPKLRASDGRVSATLPVQIELSLCKPFGSLCIGYGSCTPAYDVKASWDLTLGVDHELPNVRLSQKVTEKCSIGIDVTEHVTRVVQDQLREAQARIERELPPLGPWVDRAIAELTRPSMLTVGHCVALAPEELLLAGPTTDQGRLTVGVGLSGKMMEAACDAAPHRGRGLPVRRAKPDRPGARLELREHVPTDALRAPLAELFEAASTAELSLTLRDYTLVQDGLLLELELAGTDCGQLWLTVGLGVDVDRLSLENSRVVRSDLPPERVAAVEAAVRGKLTLVSRAPRWLDDLAIGERTDILGTLLEERTDLELEVHAPAIETAHAFTAVDGVWLTSQLRSTLALQLTSSRPSQP